MQIDINYVKAYIYNLLTTKMPAKKYQTVSKKTIDIIINEIKEYVKSKEGISIEFISDDTTEELLNSIFYIDDEDMVLRKKPNPGSVDLSVFLLCSRAKEIKQGTFSETAAFDRYVLEYFADNRPFIDRLNSYDDKRVKQQIEQLERLYKYIQNAYNIYYISEEPIMHQRYTIAEIIKKRNKLLDKLSKDSVALEWFQSYNIRDCSFLDSDFCYSRLKEDSALYDIKHSSCDNRQISKQEFLLYVEGLQQRKYRNNIKEILTSGILDDYPNEKKYIEIQAIANSIISENLFFCRDEQWIDQNKSDYFGTLSPEVIYDVWKSVLSEEIETILSISDDEYRNNTSLFAKMLNSTMAIKSFADLSPNISERINQHLTELPQFYHSSHKIGRTLLSDFSNLGGNYDKDIKKMITKE